MIGRLCFAVLVFREGAEDIRQGACAPHSTPGAGVSTMRQQLDQPAAHHEGDDQQTGA